MLSAKRAFSGWALGAALCALVFGGRAEAQLVFIGHADAGWLDMIGQPAQWSYVRRNADGFYVNFIMMRRALAGRTSASRVADLVPLFSHRSAYFESDLRKPLRDDPLTGESGADDERAIGLLGAAGFDIPFVSVSGGWDDARARTLTSYRVRPSARRLLLYQVPPWLVHGDIPADAVVPDARPEYSTTIRALRHRIDRTDGVSTDGPLSLWYVNQGGMRSGSISVVRYAHAHQKISMVMLSPHREPGNLGYDPGKFLATGQMAVRQHEDAGAVPDIYAVFEYASPVASVPEQVDGRPANTTTGMAYWLIHHIHDPQRWARLEQDSTNAAHGEYRFRLVNHGQWLDLAPLIRLRGADGAPPRDVRTFLDGIEVTAEIESVGGLGFVGPRRLWPGATRTLDIWIPSAPKEVALHPADYRDGALELELCPSVGATSEVEQRFALRATP